MNELPRWDRGDTLKSFYGVLQLGKQAVARLVMGPLDRIDTKYANQLNTDEDEAA